MDRTRRIGIGLVALVVALVGVGWFVVLRGGGGQADRETTEQPPTDDELASVEGCPLRMDLPEDFRVRETDDDSPAFRAVSDRRRIDVTIDCRQSDEEIDADSFLDETYRGVRGRYGEALSRRHTIDSEEVVGWWVSRVASGRYRFFNVALRGGIIVTMHVGAPKVDASEAFNEALVERYVRWE